MDVHTPGDALLTSMADILRTVFMCGKSYWKIFRKYLRGLKFKTAVIVLVITFVCAKIFLDLASNNLQVKYHVPASMASSSPHLLAGADVKTFRPWQKFRLDSPEHTQRLKLANATCLRNRPGSARTIIYDKEKRMANCIVPKVGSTYWINIFRFLRQDATANMTYKSPMDIPRIVTHYGPKLTKTSIESQGAPPPFLFNKPLRFMFVREPYSRLWSAWIDKFWLPDFWMLEAIRLGVALNLPREAVACPKNITFPLFLKYITLPGDPMALNQHWAPYKHLCDPCLFRPHVIGKLETFTRDSRAILDAVNLTWVLNPTGDQPTNLTEQQRAEARDRSLVEISLLTAYNLEIWLQRGYIIQACFPTNELYQRLWKAFQYNGHLPADVGIPSQFLQGGNTTEQEFLDACHETYRAWNATGKTGMREQKRAALVANYRGVPSDIMEKLRKLYASDFEMFGYDEHPAYLFEDRSAR